MLQDSQCVYFYSSMVHLQAILTRDSPNTEIQQKR